MAEPVAGWLRANVKFRDFLNSNPRSDLDNRMVFARAYQGLGHSFNAPSPAGEAPQGPENSLSPESFGRGWEGAFGGREKPWL